MDGVSGDAHSIHKRLAQVICPIVDLSKCRTGVRPTPALETHAESMNLPVP